MKFRRYSHKVGYNVWHFEWCPKYRYEMMKQFKHKNLVLAAIRKAASEHGIVVLELEVMPEHVHLLCRLPNNLTDSRALALLKGRSAYLIFRNQPKFRLRYPNGHFWSSGSCSITVGYHDLETVTRYVRDQERHHGVVYA